MCSPSAVNVARTSAPVVAAACLAIALVRRRRGAWTDADAVDVDGAARGRRHGRAMATRGLFARDRAGGCKQSTVGAPQAVQSRAHALHRSVPPNGRHRPVIAGLRSSRLAGKDEVVRRWRGGDRGPAADAVIVEHVKAHAEGCTVSVEQGMPTPPARRASPTR